MLSGLENYSKYDHSENDSVVMAILTHGADYIPYGTQKPYSITEKPQTVFSLTIILY